MIAWAGRAALLVGLLGACAPKTSLGIPLGKANRVLTGEWQDAGGAHYIFERRGREMVCSSAIDSDGEHFEVQSSGWYGGVYSWTVLVPSTGYILTHQITSLEPDVFTAAWRNQHDQGRERFTRP